MNYSRLQRSFRDAWHGLKFVFKHEQNFRIQLVVGILTLGAGALLKIHRFEFFVIGLLVLLVLVLELLNTSLEKSLDILKPRLQHEVGVIKDVMAASVFIAALGALVIAIIIFTPRLVERFFK